MGTRRQASTPTGKGRVDLGEDALLLERQVCFALVVASRASSPSTGRSSSLSGSRIRNTW